MRAGATYGPYGDRASAGCRSCFSVLPLRGALCNERCVLRWYHIDHRYGTTLEREVVQNELRVRRQGNLEEMSLRRRHVICILKSSLGNIPASCETVNRVLEFEFMPFTRQLWVVSLVNLHFRTK